MRVISGLLKGRRLTQLKRKNSFLRPTTDFVKESIFNRLGQDLKEHHVLDLFSGTGSLAIEAYSRGASYIEAVEKSKTSVSLIYRNLKLLKIENSIKVIHADVFKYLRNYKGNAFDIVLIDPPFKEKISNQVMETLCQSLVCKKYTQVVIEFGAKEKVKKKYSGLFLKAKKKWSEKAYFLFEKQ